MMIKTTAGVPMDANMLSKYFKKLVGLFFKILPLWENRQPEDIEAKDGLITYMQSLQAELLGCSELVTSIKEDPSMISLLSILQYLIDNPELNIRVVRREVFKAISICNNLKSRYAITCPEEDENESLGDI